MSHTYSQNYQHIVFSTKERQKLISKSMQPKLWSYIAGIGRNHEFLVLANGGMEDHCASTDSVAADIVCRQGRLSDQNEFLKMGERAWDEVCMARRVWRF